MRKMAIFRQPYEDFTLKLMPPSALEIGNPQPNFGMISII